MHEGANFQKKKFFGHEKQPFELQQGSFAPIGHSSYIDKTNQTFHTTTKRKNAEWLRMNHTSNQPGVQTPDTERVSAQSGQREQGDRDTVRVSAQSGHRKGGPRHYDLRTELGGGRPK